MVLTVIGPPSVIAPAVPPNDALSPFALTQAWYVEPLDVVDQRGKVVSQVPAPPPTTPVPSPSQNKVVAASARVARTNNAIIRDKVRIVLKLRASAQLPA